MAFTSVKYKCQRKELLSAGYRSVLLPQMVVLVFYADDVLHGFVVIIYVNNHTTLSI